MRFKAQHHHRRGIGRTRQPETIGVFDAHAIECDHALATGEGFRRRLQAGDELERLALVHADIEFGRIDRIRQGFQHGGRLRFARQNFQQPRPGIEAVIKAIPAFDKEHVPAHLAGQRRAGFFQLGFNQRVAGVPHHRLAATGANPRRKIGGAFHVIDNLAAGYARKHIGSKQHQLAVGMNNLPAAGDHAEAVAIAIKGQPQFGIQRAHGGNQVLQVFGFGRVGMMVRELAVHVAKEFGDLAAQRAEQLRRHRPRHAVAAVDDDAHRAREAHIRSDARQIRGQHVGGFPRARAVGEIAVRNALAQRLNMLAKQRLPGDDHFQAVVLGRIVAAGDRYTTVAAEVMRSKVGHRRGHAANIDHVHTGGANALGQRRAQFRAGQAPVAPDGDALLGAFARQRTQRVTNRPRRIGSQRAPDNAANVIGFENFSGGNGIRSNHDEQLPACKENGTR